MLDAELRLTHPVTPRLQLEPMLAFRQWSPADYRGGRLKSGGLLARVGLTDRLSATAAGRYDGGWIYAQGRGFAFLKGTGRRHSCATSGKRGGVRILDAPEGR